MGARMVTVEEVARELHAAPGLVLALIRQGKLPAVRVGEAWRVAPVDLDRFRALVAA